MAAVVNEEVDKLVKSVEKTTLEDLQSRHRRERKELQAKIQALKKNAPKSDKKKRKEVMEEVTSLENELEQRQLGELKAMELALAKNDLEVETGEKIQVNICNNNVPYASDGGSDPENDNVIIAPTQRISKAQKRRDKKTREAKEREEQIRIAAEEDIQFAPKAVEARNMQAKLKQRKLLQHQIASDGDCLYNAIRHQLLVNGCNEFNVEELRAETAKYVRANKEALICYMTNPQTDEMLNDNEFEAYCDAIKSTHVWGGQIELKALSAILKVPIEVLQAEGPSTVLGADEFAGPRLSITYHRHLYSLGEHYNSTLPLDPNADTQ